MHLTMVLMSNLLSGDYLILYGIVLKEAAAK